MGDRTGSGIKIRPLRGDELPAAAAVLREAFAAELGIADPSLFQPGADLIGFRWRMNPPGVLAAARNGELLGTNVATCWGSVGIFGPLSVHPSAWNAGVGRALVGAAVDLLERAGCSDLVLYTLANSPKHINLYRRFGYWPRFLTAVTAKPLDGAQAQGRWSGLAARSDDEREAGLDELRLVTDSVYAGLDVRDDARALLAQAAGDVVVVDNRGGLDGLALCHFGAGSEAEAGAAFVKFGAVLPGRQAAARFDLLLEACEQFARARGADRIVAGINLAREPAWRILQTRGYRTTSLGVAMHRPNRPAYDRPAAYVIDDWR